MAPRLIAWLLLCCTSTWMHALPLHSLPNAEGCGEQALVLSANNLRAPDAGRDTFLHTGALVPFAATGTGDINNDGSDDIALLARRGSDGARLIVLDGARGLRLPSGRVPERDYFEFSCVQDSGAAGSLLLGWTDAPGNAVLNTFAQQQRRFLAQVRLDGVAVDAAAGPGGHWALLEQGGTGTMLRLHLGTAGVTARRTLTLAEEPTALALVGDWPSASAVLWLYTSRDSAGRSHLRFAASGNATVPDAVALPAGAGTVRKLSARRALNGDLVVAAAMDGESGDGRSVWLTNLSTGLVAVIRANGQVRDIQLSSAVTERLLVLQGDDDETLELDSHDLTGSLLGQAVLGKPGSVQRVRLLPSKDATLYEDFSGAVANGSGEGLFVGFTGQGRETRALMRFRLHDAIPPGSSILAGQLTLVQTRSRNPALPLAAFELERHWAEGASNPGGEEGTGTLAQPGDVTWLHANRPVWAWTRAGGDFGAAPLTDQIVRTGSNTLSLSGAAVARLQQWLDTPELNRGLLLKCGGEASSCQAIRLGSRNSADASEWPWLEVEFALPAE